MESDRYRVRPKKYRDGEGFSEHDREWEQVAPDIQQWEYFDMALTWNYKAP